MVTGTILQQMLNNIRHDHCKALTQITLAFLATSCFYPKSVTGMHQNPYQSINSPTNQTCGVLALFYMSCSPTASRAGTPSRYEWNANHAKLCLPLHVCQILKNVILLQKKFLALKKSTLLYCIVQYRTMQYNIEHTILAWGHLNGNAQILS